MYRGHRARRLGQNGAPRRPLSSWVDDVFRVLSEADDPLPERELLRRLGTRTGRDADRRLGRLVEEGWLVRDATRRLAVVQDEGVLERNPRGFAFVNGRVGTVFIPPGEQHGALHGDRVRVWVRFRDERGPEGRVMAVLERGVTQVVGTLVRRRGILVVEPRDDRLPTVVVGARARRDPWAPGQWVVAEIAGPVVGDGAVRGRIVRVLGDPRAPGVGIDAVVAEFGLPLRFPRAVEQEAEALPPAVRRPERRGREDLTHAGVVTIDGADAKDLDDAVSIQRRPDGWIVGVHIADVSYYVPEHSALDHEARERGTSVYLVDRVIPMLPPALSNGIASLNPGVPRLTVSVWMRLDAEGAVQETRMTRSVIRSRHRLTYEAVNRALAGSPGRLAPLLPWLEDARTLTEQLYARRVARGALDFDVPEPHVELGPDGAVVSLGARERGPAERLIEELMLLANETVARTLERERLPGLYRIHEEPDPEKLRDFRVLVGALGYRLPTVVTPGALQDLLRAVKGKPEEGVVTLSLLRSMRQARYAASVSPHFGLASAAYTHFTSPIRRYPDLFVHRVLTAWLTGTLTPALRDAWAEMAPMVAERSSERERVAVEAERASVLVKQVEWMAEHVGDTFRGVVSGVAPFGVFVTLPNLVEGLVRLEDLPADVYRHDPVHHTLTGARTRTRYRLGDALTVRVARVDPARRRIDFVPERGEANGAAASAVRRPKPRRRAAPGL